MLQKIILEFKQSMEVLAVKTCWDKKSRHKSLDKKSQHKSLDKKSRLKVSTQKSQQNVSTYVSTESLDRMLRQKVSAKSLVQKSQEKVSTFGESLDRSECQEAWSWYFSLLVLIKIQISRLSKPQSLIKTTFLLR